MLLCGASFLLQGFLLCSVLEFWSMRTTLMSFTLLNNSWRWPFLYIIFTAFMSRNLTLRLTVAPASRHTRANVLSVGTARHFNWPDCGQAARYLPTMSFWPPHSHLASVRSNGRRNLSNTSVRKCMGCTWNNGPVGEPWTAAPALGPKWTASEPGLRRMIWRAPRSPESDPFQPLFFGFLLGDGKPQCA